ncbi:UPF0389 protein CG9231 isoform X1 [Osmia lignaria lignaria]|uniref:protein FAM162B-like n=1 Tax=Osmia lignaria TaxID=473952 RepID=UPI0014794C1C|nr:protein FAM162B-like [Osmia lignaria]XP_034174070.1 protein FAM162B-like [Osmia lignaria]XP_034174071.1 protein FAM162B-like [Osmia lignaria]
MFHIRLVKQFRSIRIRQFHSTLIKYEDKVVPENKSTKPPQAQENILGSPFHTVTNFDKRILVWVKRYPSMDQVPDRVSIDCIQKAHAIARVRGCLLMTVLAIIGFMVSIYIGKKETSGGKNIMTERLKWYKQMEEKGRKEAMEKQQ